MSIWPFRKKKDPQPETEPAKTDVEVEACDCEIHCVHDEGTAVVRIYAESVVRQHVAPTDRGMRAEVLQRAEMFMTNWNKDRFRVIEERVIDIGKVSEFFLVLKPQKKRFRFLEGVGEYGCGGWIERLEQQTTEAKHHD